MKGDWLKLGMGISLPATDGKEIYFSCVCFEIILLLFLVQALILVLRTVQKLVVGKNIANLQSLYKIQNIPIKTYFILTLKI